MTKVTIGNKEEKLEPKICRNTLHGKDTGSSCVVNSKYSYSKKDDKVSMFPIKVKKLPVTVDEKRFNDLTTKAGKTKRIYTYSLKY